MTKIISYKGFNKDWTCRGFQYEVGKSYIHEGNVKACKSGFHACEYPLEVLSFYPPNKSVYAVVEQSGVSDKENEKIASEKIRIVSELSIADLIKAAVEHTFSNAKPINPSTAALATGEYGASLATGTRGAASATGTRGAASATGDYGAASATGFQGAASATGPDCVALATGFMSKAMACDSSAICLVNRNPENGQIRHIRAAKVGEFGIKPNVWYSLNDLGEFVEVQE